MKIVYRVAGEVVAHLAEVEERRERVFVEPGQRCELERVEADIDATGQPMSPDPFLAVKNAIEHYRVDEVLISTFAGETSRWLSRNASQSIPA